MELKKKLTYKNFEEAFLVLLDKAKHETVSIETILTVLSGKGKILLLTFLSLGLGQVPGVAVLLGLAIGYLGVSIAMAKSFIWVPETFLRKKLPPYFLIKTINQILRLLKFMKRWSCPRYAWATQRTETRIINGLMISLVGISFAASPPLPFTGLIACVAIFCIAIGLLNDDGIYILIGYLCGLFYLAVTLALLKFCSVGQLLQWLKSFAAYLSGSLLLSKFEFFLRQFSRISL